MKNTQHDYAVAFGSKGGIARAKKLTQAQRTAIARKGGLARAKKAQAKPKEGRAT